jgi:hypothetical protein
VRNWFTATWCPWLIGDQLCQEVVIINSSPDHTEVAPGETHTLIHTHTHTHIHLPTCTKAAAWSYLSDPGRCDF